MALLFDRRRQQGADLAEFLRESQEVLAAHKKSMQRERLQADPVKSARRWLSDEVILGDMLREEIRDAWRQLGLVAAGNANSEQLLGKFERLDLWRYVQHAAPARAIDLVTAIRDLGFVVELLSTAGSVTQTAAIRLPGESPPILELTELDMNASDNQSYIQGLRAKGLLGPTGTKAEQAATADDHESRTGQLGKRMASGATGTKEKHRERGPDLETSRERVQLEDKLRGELAMIAARTKKYLTLEQLKRDLPDSELWKLLSLGEQRELLSEPIRPRVYARFLAARKYGVTPHALKKDHHKLRNGGKVDLSGPAQ